MDYELAKELKEAGFPVTDENAAVFIKETGGTEPFPSPTLSELIEACGDEFKSLRNFRHEMWAAHGRMEGDRQFNETWPDSPEWIAEAVKTYEADEGTIGPIHADGRTPSEAVAQLWLALQDKK